MCDNILLSARQPRTQIYNFTMVQSGFRECTTVSNKLLGRKYHSADHPMYSILSDNRGTNELPLIISPRRHSTYFNNFDDDIYTGC